MKATLKEVAKLAGVSTATVSNVINETKYVSDEVKKQVFAAMKELSYVPNDVAKSLRVKESRLIGLMISDITNPFFSLVVRGIEDTLAKEGYNVLLCNTDSNIDKEKEYLKVLLGKRIDGLIVSSSGDTEQFFREMADIDVPLVFLNRCPAPLISDVVTTDNVKGAYLATEHLIGHGYRRIGIITGPLCISTGRDRLKGFKQAMNEYGLEVDNKLIKEGLFNVQSGYSLIKDFMSESVKPEAVFISNNFMTLGAYHYFHDAGISVPGDLAVVGFDDPDWARIANPPLTAIRQPDYEQGERVAQLIMQRIKTGNQSEPQEIYLNPSLIARKSCGC
ncbi:LacI family DNA-binding transcriptional regulator [Paenibacillus rhizophilus]|uniref:LacI family transcriptional regulator n=1 Tax=Paenibacillus rhizophilus TaxID=1850366 RepID=A0A3N9P110_9BACL|nr:LacI family DNA-binding transcriptional regulator [Paenibacillus rhizophilus]RQW09873.1 LacI family transcriptional regulator [Paenibacillus rhizophilus]